MLKRLIYTTVLLLTAVSLFNGCMSKPANSYRNMTDMANHFAASSLEIEVVQPLLVFFGADEAMSLQISGNEIGIYRFNSHYEVQMNRLNDIKSKGYVYRNGQKYPVLVNGTFMLIGYEKNHAKHEIIKVFNSFK